MFTCDIGGTLNRVVHFYHYTSWEERDAARQAAAKDSQWQNEYIKVARDYVAHQESSAYLPAGSVLDAAGSLPLQELAAKSGVGQDGPPGMYELRHYQLHPGYGSVPKLLEAFQKGIPHKIAADKDGTLAFFGYTDVGVLNSVIELWRYPSAAACIAARKAAREVTQWRETIGAVTPGVQHFRSAFLNPTAFSPLR